jgi:malonyl-CoA decarboxylase
MTPSPPTEPTAGRRSVSDTLRLLRSFTSESLEGAARRIRGEPDPDLPERDRRRLGDVVEAALDPRLGPVVARARAVEVLTAYEALGPAGKRRFFTTLARDHATALTALDEAVADYSARRSATAASDLVAGDTAATRARLRAVLVPGWERLFRLLVGLDGGVKRTVDLRADLRRVVAGRDQPPGPAAVDPATAAALTEMDADLQRLLEQVFDVGLLELRQITWDSPASLLEKLIAYEAVHEITSWGDLKNRLRPDRRCFGFFHPGMPGEPIIFVEVALVQDLPDDIVPLLDQASPVADAAEATWAIFYSISACQPGLAGVGLGDFLIKRVVNDLRRDLPGVKNFATLSPLPGFRRWVERLQAREPASLLALVGDELRSRLARPPSSGAEPPSGGAGVDPSARLAALLADVAPAAGDRSGADRALQRDVLLRLGAHYLLRERHGTGVADRVANFHLTNGARVERLNWGANLSAAGIAESYGLMVNYRYDLGRIEEHHLDYVQRGRVPAAGAVSKLVS